MNAISPAIALRREQPQSRNLDAGTSALTRRDQAVPSARGFRGTAVYPTNVVMRLTAEFGPIGSGSA